jgi:hypothetical protein
MATIEKKEESAYPLAGKKLGLFGLAGAGKSTVAVLLAHEFSKRGYEVCLLDADSKNVGPHRALGFRDAPSPLIGYCGDMALDAGLATCPVADPTPLSRAVVYFSQLPSSSGAYSMFPPGQPPHPTKPTTSSGSSFGWCEKAPSRWRSARKHFPPAQLR